MRPSEMKFGASCLSAAPQEGRGKLVCGRSWLGSRSKEWGETDIQILISANSRLERGVFPEGAEADNGYLSESVRWNWVSIAFIWKQLAFSWRVFMHFFIWDFFLELLRFYKISDKTDKKSPIGFYWRKRSTYFSGVLCRPMLLFMKNVS